VETLTPAPDSTEKPARAPNGRALVVAAPSGVSAMEESLAIVGYEAEVVEDPYQAMAQLARRPLAFRALVLGLSAVHPPELAVIESVKRRFPHVDVLLADAAGRSGSLTEAVRLGADALLEGQRLRRFAHQGFESPAPAAETRSDQPGPGEPVLTTDELKALLDD
jgi:DNA-binding NtrC family response regulator